LLTRPPPRSPLFPYTTLFRSRGLLDQFDDQLRRLESVRAPDQYRGQQRLAFELLTSQRVRAAFDLGREPDRLRESYGRTLFGARDRKSTRLNSSHDQISYAVF